MAVAKITASFGVWLLLRATYEYWIPLISPFVNFVLVLCLSWFLGKKVAKHVLIKKLLPSVDPKGRAVLITGCDSGFGHMTALALTRMGFTVIATVLDEEGEGAKNLKKKGYNRIQVIKMNVTKSEEIQDAVTFVEYF